MEFQHLPWVPLLITAPADLLPGSQGSLLWKEATP